MKHILLIIFYILSFNMYSQSDSTIHKTNFLKKSDPKVWLISGAIVAIPSTGMLFLSDDKTSKGIFGTLSITGNLALITGAYKAFKEDHKLRNKFVHYSIMSIGGVCDGISEELQHHYSKVKEKFPNMNDNFFNPQISWSNKYKNGDQSQGEAYFGSTTIFVAGTDGYHAFRGISKGALIGGLVTFQKGKTFWKTVGEAVISMGFYTLGKGSVHYLINN